MAPKPPKPVGCCWLFWPKPVLPKPPNDMVGEVDVDVVDDDRVATMYAG